MEEWQAEKVLWCWICNLETGTEWPGSGKREKMRRGEQLRLEVESGVIKIHPTVQTKGGMKKGENAGETRE